MKFDFSSPRYPQSNGLSEKAVGISKNILKRCYEANEVDQFQYRLLEYNTTPIASMRSTPSELFFGRLIKSKLPVSGSLLVRKNFKEQDIQQRIANKKEKQKYYYNRNAKSLPTLAIGDNVIFKKNSKEWNYGTIVGDVNGRSYVIRDNFSSHFRRNRRFIAKTKNNVIDPSELLLEEGALTDKTGHESMQIHVVPPDEQAMNINHGDGTEEVNETELSVVDNDVSVSSSDEYDTADSSVSETESDAEPAQQPVNVSPAQPAPIVSRYGRAIRPRQMYGFNY